MDRIRFITYRAFFWLGVTAFVAIIAFAGYKIATARKTASLPFSIANVARSCHEYVIKPGDTAWDIYSENGYDDWGSFKSSLRSEGVDPSLLKPGQTICLP